MKFLLFYGDINERKDSSLSQVFSYFHSSLSERYGQSVEELRLSDAGIPFFNVYQADIPLGVQRMITAFQNADHHIWFTPLYHGSMTGAMKNALDWLELTRTAQPAYLTEKYVGLVSLSDGLQSMQAINAMDAVAKSLRAWTVPFSVPINKTHLRNDGALSNEYIAKFDLLIDLMLRESFSKELVS